MATRRTNEKNVSIKNHRRTFFVAASSAAANAAIKSRQRRTDADRGRGSLPSLRRRLPLSLATHRGQEGTSKDDGVACHRLMHGGGRGRSPISMSELAFNNRSGDARVDVRRTTSFGFPIFSRCPCTTATEVHECCFPPTVGPSVTKSSPLLSSVE